MPYRRSAPKVDGTGAMAAASTTTTTDSAAAGAAAAAPPSPSTFLSPRITADLDGHLDAIEELLLSGDGDGPSSPGAALAQTLNVTTTTANRSTSAEAPSADYSLTNAVHMEVQENAKLPTFNLPVDRSNASWQVPAARGRRSLGAKRSSRSRTNSVGSGDSTGPGNHSANGSGHATPAFPLSPIPKLRHAQDVDSHHGPMESATSRAIDEIMRLNENDMNLTELFLDGQDRSSAALAYSHTCDMPRLPSNNSLDEMNKLPDLSKKRKNGAVEMNGQHDKIAKVPRLQPNPSMLHIRRKPLPIPIQKKPSPPRGQKMAAAVVTAASIANGTSTTESGAPGGITQQTAAALSLQPTQLVNNPLQPRGGATAISVPQPKAASPARMSTLPPPTLPPPPLVAHKAAPASVPRPVPKPGTTPQPALKPGTIPRPSGPPPIPPPKGPIPNKPPPAYRPPPNPVYASQAAAQAQARARQLAAHAKTKASITHATAQRTKYGFGGDHRVPSVPAPPPNVNGYKAMPISVRPPVAAARKPPGAMAGAPKTFVPSTAGLPKEVGSVIAYERKKQRAKDARIKLNEAIEELGIAIDLAGSQSKERFDYIVKSTGCANPHVVRSGPPPPQHPLARLMDATIQQASSAKKWDRPSFVGLSATVIRSLNAQCEGLMREVAQLRNLARKDLNLVADRVDSGPASSGTTPDGVVGAPGEPLNDHNATTDEPVAKKQKLDPPPDYMSTAAKNAPRLSQLDQIMIAKAQLRSQAIRNTIGTPNILKNIASFLDPGTLCTCLRVSKRWRRQNIFQNPELWLDLCVKRFGASATRKWQDHEDEGKKRKSANANLVLYGRMSERNVKPYSAMEGTAFLGGASLGGLVGCWVSLMDRSNGETSRSVMQRKLQNGQPKLYYESVPVVELRILIQNTGYPKGTIIIPEQQFSVDASTRRKGESMPEVTGDERFRRRVLHVERSPSPGEPDPQRQKALSKEMCHLRLFESAALAVYVHARGCSTTSKFCNRAKKVQLLVCVDGTTRPLAIPFHCMAEHQLKQNMS